MMNKVYFEQNLLLWLQFPFKVMLKFWYDFEQQLVMSQEFAFSLIHSPMPNKNHFICN